MSKQKNVTFNITDSVGVYGDQKDAIQAMLDYDYICGKKATSIHAIIIPSQAKQGFEPYFFGNEEILIPVFPTISQAAKETSFTLLVNFASSRSAFQTTVEALEATSIDKIIVIAEGMPEREARILKAMADAMQKVIIGPATVGGFVSQVIKIGNAGGTIENTIQNRLDVRGNVGIVTKSGGMLNELMTIVNRSTNGVCEAVAIGGDRFPMTTLSEQVLRFEQNEDIKLILLLGEIGGRQEYEIAQLVREKKVKKPIVAWISGEGGKIFKEQIQFGHAGAMANNEDETAVAKIAALRAEGIAVPKSFDDLESLLKKQAKALNLYDPPIEKGQIEGMLPYEFTKLIQQRRLRYPRHILSSISRHKGHDATYLGKDIAQASHENGIGYILGLLWFKKEFPKEITDIFELFIKITADHGAAVSGAHNTIVTARAGKDLISSLVSGLLTIGPRFGGAVNDSARYFKYGYDHDMSPFEFVAYMKELGVHIPGIGHKVKSRTNPDKRVELLKEVMEKTFTKHPYYDYALEVEEVTIRKRDNLLLNVDGAIAAMLLDILSQYFTSEEIDELIAMEAFNAFFTLGRSIGLIGHFIDQKRLDQGLYRHPDWDILEIK